MLTRKQQILFKIEANDGVLVTPAAADAVLVYDPKIGPDSVAFLDRVPAGASLSRENTPPGITTRPGAWKSDFRGSGALGTPPEWGKMARAAGHREVEIIKMALTVVSASERFQVGELVQQGSSAIRGIVLTDLVGVDGTILVAVISGTFTAATITGESGGATATAGAPVTTGVGYAYFPESERLIQVGIDSWLAADPAATGIILSVLRTGGFVVGALQVKALVSGWAIFQAELLWGECLVGDVLSDGVNTSTVQVVAQIRGLSATVWGNHDGFLRKIGGARGNLTLAGKSSEPLIFDWNFTGSQAGQSAALPITVAGLATIRAPRLFGAYAGVGVATQFRRLPFHSISLTPANTLANRPDINAPGGSRGTALTNRDPQITIEVDHVNTDVNWESLRDLETPVRIGVVAGGNGTGTYAGRTTSPSEGRTMVLAAPNCQVTEVGDGDADGFSTRQITLKPRRVQETGDDEYVLAMF